MQLFNTFGQCDYLMYYGTTEDENCKMIHGGEDMATYLGSCNEIGQPTRHTNGQCMANDDRICDAAPCDVAAGRCDKCDPASKCTQYQQTECAISAPKTETLKADDFDNCQLQCTSLSTSTAITYFDYNRETQDCICYNKGTRTCVVEVIMANFMASDIDACK